MRHFSRFLFSLALSIATLTLGGCGVVDWLVGNNINVNGAKPTVSMERAPLRGYAKLEWLTGSENYFDQADLVAELDPAYTCPNSYTLAQCLAKALDNFYWNVNGKSDEQRKLRRNAVQGRLIAASNSACREFTQHLNSYQSYTNFVLGTAAVGAGAAGAIVSPAVAAKALAGSAAAITGTKAEFNSDVFQKEFVSTITRGIDKRRRDFLKSLTGRDMGGAALQTSQSPGAGGGVPQDEPGGFQALSLEAYPVEEAIADAIYYNDLCSLDKGLEELNKSLDIADNPGLD